MMRKVSPIYSFKYYVPDWVANEMWVEKFWIAHIFDHPVYGHRDNLVERHDLRLRPAHARCGSRSGTVRHAG